MADVKLLPCPFCGVVPVIERCADTVDYMMGPRKWWGICCRSTLNHGGSCAVEIRPQASIEAAAKRWNTRAPAQAALEQARTEVEHMQEALRLARPHVEAHRDYCLGKHGVVGKMDTILAAIDAALKSPTPGKEQT